MEEGELKREEPAGERVWDVWYYDTKGGEDGKGRSQIRKIRAYSEQMAKLMFSSEEDIKEIVRIQPGRIAIMYVLPEKKGPHGWT